MNSYIEQYAERSEVQSLELMDSVVSQATHTLLQGIGKREVEGETTRYTYTMPTRMPDWFEEGHPLRNAEVLTPEILLSMERYAREKDSRVVKVKAVIASTVTDISISNNLSDIPVHDHRERYVLMIHIVLQQDDRHEMGFASQVFHDAGFLTPQSSTITPQSSPLNLQPSPHNPQPASLNPQPASLNLQSSTLNLQSPTLSPLLSCLVEKALSQASHLFDAITPQGGDMPVVMSAGASGILLHEAIGHAFEADFNRLGTSIFSDKMGEQICRKGITIIDNGTLLGGVGTLAYDDEGNPTQCTHLVEDGRLVSYLHDRISAAHFGVKPTGNGRRQSFRHAPIPRMTNTYMLPGESSEEDIIRSVKHGIYACSFTNGQVQIGAGDFTFFLKTGFLIEDGHLTSPIRDVNIIGNGPRALADISLVGNNLLHDTSAAYCGKAGQQVPVGQGLPTVLVDNLTVGGLKK